jgi:hypothetical protein
MTVAQGLSADQLAFFETFGFLRLPGLFLGEIDQINQGFERVFANDEHVRMETFEELHGGDRRLIVPQFITKDPYLAGLLDDPRVTGIVSSVLGEDYTYAESDGNLFDCESHWHADTYGAPMTIRHLKLSFYLDPLRADSGAIRVVPGTNHFMSPFARSVRSRTKDPSRITEEFGVDPRDLPSYPIETDPGDLVIWDFRTIHGSYGGGVRRRLFSINFREHVDAEVPEPAGAPA